MGSPIGIEQNALKRKSDFISEFFGLLSQKGFDAAFAYVKDVYQKSGGRFGALEIMNDKAIQKWATQPGNEKYLERLTVAVQNRAASEVANALSKGGDAYAILAKNNGPLLNPKDVLALPAVAGWAKREGKEAEINKLSLRFEDFAPQAPIKKAEVPLPDYKVTATPSGLLKGEISSDNVSKMTGKEGEASIVAYGISKSILEINLSNALQGRLKKG